MTNSPLAGCPDAVRAYLSLTAAGDRAAAVVCFAETAHVVDDGRDYRGTEDIRGWLDRVAGRYTYTTTPLSARTVDAVAGRTVVTCRLEGAFPGSPVDLDYRFDLDAAGRISRLEIVVSRPAPETAMEVTG
ncbi:nuclear transport factor 2 family protein [Microbispora sp. ZYX-F-249]|uniref:Nuclear transport factor 2 family protein n=1 Tax=Microbispora maris TaxID=3144104 RepID=A0ABV0AXB4_9ACTN